MKIRIGVRFAGWPFERTRDFWDFVDLVEDSGLDSIWLNDRIRTPTPALEPITGLAMIAGRTERIKFGTWRCCRYATPWCWRKKLPRLTF